MKRALLWIAAVTALLLLAWTVGLLYVQGKVRRAVGRLREEHLLRTEPGSTREFAALSSAEEVARLGCRALPLLMAELDPKLSPYYLCRVAECINVASDGEAPRAVFEEEAAQKGRAVDVLLAWWREEGPRHHQWWRFWTSRCQVLVK